MYIRNIHREFTPLRRRFARTSPRTQHPVARVDFRDVPALILMHVMGLCCPSRCFVRVAIHFVPNPVAQGSRLFVTVADCKGSGQIQQKVMDLGEVGLIAGKWHAVVICHKRSSALLFNKDQLEASAVVVS